MERGGMAADYDIRYIEVTDHETQYAEYEQSLNEAMQSVDSAVSALAGLGSFQGKTALAAKSYFQDVHQGLAEALCTLAKQLHTTYVTDFSSRFAEDPIAEGEASHDARWPSSVIGSARSKMASYRDDQLAQAERNLSRAADSFPAGISFDIPSAGDLSAAFEECIDKTNALRLAVGDADGEGETALASEQGDFDRLATGLRQAIASCVKSVAPITDYQPGSFLQTVEELGIADTLGRCREYQAENQKLVTQSLERSISVKNAQIEYEREQALNEKKFWSVIGTIAQVAIVVGAGLAMVATAGTASPLLFGVQAAVSTLGFVGASNDLLDRVEQTGKVLTEADVYADVEEDELQSVSHGIAKGVGEGTGLLLEHDYTKRGILSGDDAFKPGSAKAFTGGQIIDGGFALLEEAVDSDEAKTGVKITGEVVSYAWDGFTDKFSGAGTIGFAGDVVQAGADYFMGEADEQLESLREESQSLERLREGMESNETYAWSARW